MPHRARYKLGPGFCRDDAAVRENTMLRNYLAAALRNLFRNRAYAAINIFGLALGFAAAILIALYVRHEYSYDRFFPDHDRIYQMRIEYRFPGKAPVSL